jgi:hypothetical protein
MTKHEIVAAIDMIIAGVEFERFTIENLHSLRAKILANEIHHG